MSAGKNSKSDGQDPQKAGKGPRPAEDPAAHLVIGLKFDGSDAFDYYRPTLLKYASTIAMAEAAPGGAAALAPRVKWGSCIPLPHGMRLRRRPSEDMPLLSMGVIRSLRFRCIYGYVGEIKFIKDEPDGLISFESPALVAVIVKLWRRYGSEQKEQFGSWAFCRLLAFASTALFEGSTQVVTVGDPVSGIIEATSGSLMTAKMTGWAPVTAAEWKLRQTRSFHEDGFELNGDALATLPAIAADNFGYMHHPNVPYARTHGHKEPKYFDTPAPPAERGRNSGSSPAPRNSPERRLRERFYKKQAGKKAAPLASSADKQGRPARMKAPPTNFVSAIWNVVLRW